MGGQIADGLDEGRESWKGDCGMIISVFRIYNLLKAYHRNLQWSLEKSRGDAKRSQERDRVEISVEERKKRIRQKAASEVLERLTSAKEA